VQIVGLIIYISRSIARYNNEKTFVLQLTFALRDLNDKGAYTKHWWPAVRIILNQVSGNMPWLQMDVTVEGPWFMKGRNIKGVEPTGY